MVCVVGVGVGVGSGDGGDGGALIGEPLVCLLFYHVDVACRAVREHPGGEGLREVSAEVRRGLEQGEVVKSLLGELGAWGRGQGAEAEVSGCLSAGRETKKGRP